MSYFSMAVVFQELFNKDNLFNKQELLYLMILSFILVTLMFDSEVIW